MAEKNAQPADRDLAELAQGLSHGSSLPDAKAIGMKASSFEKGVSGFFGAIVSFF